ncbi:outer membrane receptor protein involved in Fe transport [Chitinophaga skermanii]|uniref:Outer membrane receptor protein involved in Fe transport n=1 Tax=Chitinophaga skermanii TaxID=331697 RepID=A0A327QLS8_9BACT|nr:outer membrane beta-barrel family protein [Chitinophaga skermanii]RAJ05280.1 outer membrane receptor protein involved in Fe transport [Chitinophaga skermanii]
MKQCYAILAFILAWQINAFAQNPAGAPPGGAPRGNMPKGAGAPQIGRIYGKLIDATTKQPVEYASVAILRQRDSSLVTGMLTKSNGDFNFENMPFGPLLVRINFMGYKTIFKKVTVAPQAMDQDLGNIRIEPNSKTLNAVEVTGQKSAFQMGIDKKVFNVDRNLTSVGGTATDILKNVPAVNVDIDGNVKVRNASPTIFVDGKPSTLTLDQIPADAIESVELITNPSAKYDAEGMSGILNIVLKKNKKAGINGMIQGGIATGEKYNASGNINVRQDKLNVFANYSLNANRNWGNGTTNTQFFDQKGDISSFQDQYSDQVSRGKFQFGRFGLDYYLDNRNTLSISQNIVGGSFKNYEDLKTVSSDATHAPTATSLRNSVSEFGFNNYTTQVGWKHLFAKPNKEWTADFSWNKSNNHRDGNYNTDFTTVSGQDRPSTLQYQNTKGSSTFSTLQTDFVNPIGKNGKFETGLKATYRDYSSNYSVFDHDAAKGIDTFNTRLSNDYKYNEQVYAGYVNYSNTAGNFGYQLGLRAEQYVYAGESAGVKYKPTRAVPGLFPSVYLSQKLKNEQELQLNYSRRVNRPNFFQLIPYRDFTDPYNQREGNPNLKPEYTNSLEFSYAKTWKNHNFLASIYFRNTNNLISTYTEPIAGDTMLTRFVNANRNNSYGAELTVKNQVIKGWDITTNVNLFQTDLTIDNDKEKATNSGFSWLAKINSEVKLPWGLTFQQNFQYQADAIALPAGGGRGGGGGGGGFMMIPTSSQGKVKGFNTLDLAIKKDFLKSKALSVTLTWQDVYDSRRFGMDLATSSYSQLAYRKRESEILRLNVSYRFGKFDSQIFKRKNTKADNNMGDMQSF